MATTWASESSMELENSLSALFLITTTASSWPVLRIDWLMPSVSIMVAATTNATKPMPSAAAAVVPLRTSKL